MSPRDWLLALTACAITCGVALAAEPGRLDLYVFAPDGRPAPGVEVRSGDVVTTTGRDGAARLVLPAGEHLVELRQAGRLLASRTLPVAEREVSEVIVRLQVQGRAQLDVEAPEWPHPSAQVGSDAGGELGDLEGRLTHEKDGQPVAGARVLVQGLDLEGVSDAQGRFRIRLPAGPQRISVIHPEFATATRQVHVPAAGALTFELALTPSAVQLEAHTVSGYRLEGGLASLMQERRTERAVSEVLGAEQMAKSGDSDAAEALKRVTGLTVVDGKYVYVRGMGERYSSTLLNGASLPSPEIERRVVPLDLFPTDVIESITVQKSYSPELPGEFGGGTVRINTKGIPDEGFVKATISTAYREGTTGQDGLTYDGGGTDWLGYDDGSRSLPEAVEIAAGFQPVVLRDPISGEGYPIEVLEGLGEVMPNVWTPERERTPPDVGVSLALGDRFETPAGLLGFRVGASYKNSWQQKDGLLRTLGLGGGGELTRITDYEREELTNTVDFSSLASIGWQPLRDQELTVTALWLRRTENETRVYEGLLSNDDVFTRVSSLDFVEQQLLSAQVQGEHGLFAGVTLDWSYTFAYADRYQPDWRRTRYDLEPTRGEFVLSNRPEGNQRLYSDLEDFSHDLSGGVTIPFDVWSDLEAAFAFGGAFLYRDRESQTRRFKFIHRGPISLDPDVLANPAEQVFTPDTIGADGFTFEEITRATDSYEAEQTITAAWLRLDLPLHETLDASIGARIERSRQQVSTLDLFSRNAVSQDADLDETDVLPAANLTWRFYEGMQLRGGYSRTLSRPDFRELSSAPFDQVVGAGVFVGNPDLDRTLIDNVDLRWEWYFDSDESVSVGVFFKQLHDPIETVILGGTNRTVTLQNADEGRNLGIEFEFRKRLDFFGVDFLEKFFFAGNLSLIHSDVELASTGVATNDSRPLQGQSPFVINGAFGWDDPDTRTSLTVLYNVAGKRIVGIGTFGLDDIYEQPFHQLDVVFSWGFWDGMTLKLKAENLLDSKVLLTQDGQKVTEYEKGVQFSASLSAEF